MTASNETAILHTLLNRNCDQAPHLAGLFALGRAMESADYSQGRRAHIAQLEADARALNMRRTFVNAIEGVIALGLASGITLEDQRQTFAAIAAHLADNGVS